MSTLNVTIELSAHTDERLQALLVTMNEQRAQLGKPPIASVHDMAMKAVIDQLKGWTSMAEANEIKNLKNRYEGVGPVTRAAIQDLLDAPIDPPDPVEL